MLFLIGICMFMGALGLIDPRLLNKLCSWITLNIFFSIFHMLEAPTCACIFYLNSIKSYIVYYFKRSKSDLLIAHIEKDSGHIEEYTSIATQYPTNFRILFYGHMNTPSNEFTSTINMQRLTTIPREKPVYTLSKIKIHALSIRLLKNNECYASYPVSLMIKANNMNFNYLVAGNILFDRAFVQYWFKTYHGIVIKDNQDYDVHMLNEDIEEITLTDKNYIKLTDTSYEIYNTGISLIDCEPVEL